MEAALYLLLFLVYLPVATWIHYLAIMHLKHIRDDKGLTGIGWAVGSVTLASGYAHDFLLNVIHCTVLLLEPPRETTVTARLSRHAKDDSWRGAVARFIGLHLLDPFDPSGRHL